MFMSPLRLQACFLLPKAYHMYAVSVGSDHIYMYDPLPCYTPPSPTHSLACRTAFFLHDGKHTYQGLNPQIIEIVNNVHKEL